MKPKYSLLASVVPRHLLHLVLSEAEVFAERLIEYGVNLQVVEPREHPLLRDAEDASHHAHLHVVVVLHRAGEEHSHEIHHLLVVAVRGGARHGRVVFVDDYERLLLVVEMEGLREQAEGLAEVFDISLLLADARKTVYVFGVGQRLADCLVPTELGREVHA